MNATDTFYLVGAPGAGKTTALNLAITLLTDEQPEQHDKPIPHVTYGPHIAQLGRLRQPFGGTDALSMGINPQACDYITTNPYRVILAEGDRLANNRFLQAANLNGNLHLIWLDLPAHIAHQRMTTRAQQTGNKPQTDQWWKGRNTKTLRLTQQHPHTRLNATQPPATLAQHIANLITTNCDI